MIRISVKEFKELMNQEQKNTETTNTLDAWIIKHILRKEESSPTSTTWKETPNEETS